MFRSEKHSEIPRSHDNGVDGPQMMHQLAHEILSTSGHETATRVVRCSLELAGHETLLKRNIHQSLINFPCSLHLTISIARYLH